MPYFRKRPELIERYARPGYGGETGFYANNWPQWRTANDALLEQGYWEWRDGGPYAAEVVGPNGQAGIPWANYAGWLVLTSLVTALYLRLSGDAHVDTDHAGTAARRTAGRIGALLLLPSYLAVLRWEIQQRRWRYVAYAVLFPVVVALALWGPDYRRRTEHH